MLNTTDTHTTETHTADTHTTAARTTGIHTADNRTTDLHTTRATHYTTQGCTARRVTRIILGTELESEMCVLLTPQCRFCHPRSSQMLVSPPLPHNMPPRGGTARRVPRIILGTELESEMCVLLTPQRRFCHPRSSQTLVSPHLPHNVPPRGARQGGSHRSSWGQNSSRKCVSS